MAGRPDPRGTGMWARGPRAICLVWDGDRESETAALAGSVVRTVDPAAVRNGYSQRLRHITFTIVFIKGTGPG